MRDCVEAESMEKNSFSSHRTLVLNADFRPLGFPIFTLSAQEAIAAMFLDRVSIVRESDVYAHSPSIEMRLPSVVALKNYVHVPGMHGIPLFNRQNLFVRDQGLCMYTGKKLRYRTADRAQQATIDHVVPQCRGGETSWKNCVLSSMDANTAKGSKPLAFSGFELIHQPWVPTASDLLYLWLTDERLMHMADSWLEFLVPQGPSPRVERVLEQITRIA